MEIYTNFGDVYTVVRRKMREMNGSIDLLKWMILGVISIGSFFAGYFICLVLNPKYLESKNRMASYEMIVSEYEEWKYQVTEFINETEPYLESFIAYLDDLKNIELVESEDLVEIIE